MLFIDSCHFTSILPSLAASKEPTMWTKTLQNGFDDMSPGRTILIVIGWKLEKPRRNASENKKLVLNEGMDND